MHKRVVLNVIARILMIVCFVMFVPLLWAVIDDPASVETQAFIVTIFIGLFLSSIIQWQFKMFPKDLEKINAKDSLAIVGLSWIALSVFGALPFYLSQSVGIFTDAFFETVSGFSTTGATIFTNVEILPRGILFWRSLTHWLGGMGIIVLCLALLPALGQNAFNLYKAEAPGITVERIAPRMKETAKRLWGVYFFLSFCETVLLMVAGMSLFEALCHTFGTMATGGFSTRNASIGAFGPAVQWIIIVFMFLAGANFMLHYMGLRGKIKNYFKDEEFLYYFLLVLLGVAGFTLVLSQTQQIGSPLRAAAFQVVSILTTTGYTTVDFDLWPQALRFLLIVFMFIGGCGGSTGGGMKVVRFFVSLKVALRSLVQSVLPNAVVPVRFNTVPCSEKLILSVAAYFIIYIFLFFFGAVFLTISEQCDIVSAFAASIASLSNIGPGLGKVGAVQNYAWISVPGKWMLTFLMLAGRLELYSILILFLPMSWKK